MEFTIEIEQSEKLEMNFKRAKQFIVQLFKLSHKKEQTPMKTEPKQSGMGDYAKWAGVEATDEKFVELYQRAQNAALCRKNLACDRRRK